MLIPNFTSPLVLNTCVSCINSYMHLYLVQVHHSFLFICPLVLPHYHTVSIADTDTSSHFLLLPHALVGFLYVLLPNDYFYFMQSFFQELRLCSLFWNHSYYSCLVCSLCSTLPICPPLWLTHLHVILDDILWGDGSAVLFFKADFSGRV